MVEVSTPRSPKRKKPRFADVASNFEAGLLTSVLPEITSSGAEFVVVGIDMAAQEGNWGLSVIVLDRELKRGSLRLLLPHRFDLDRFKKKHPIKPSAAFIAQLVSGLADHQIPFAVAVDVPFGWPQEHSSFLKDSSAAPAPGKVISPPSRCCFEYRLCDRAMMRLLKREGRSAAVLAVGADKIASAAFQWASQRLEMPGFERVDLGYEPQMIRRGAYFETYPSAFVRLNYPSFAGYKTLKEANAESEPAQEQPSERQARHDLLDAIRADYQINTDRCSSALEAACATSASDAFDGFLSAITAWDYLKWRTQPPGSIRMSSPTELLGPDKAATEKVRIEKEGWFLVRLPEGIVCTLDDLGQQCNEGESRLMCSNPTINTPPQGRTIAVVGDVYRFLATGEDTDGKYALWEALVPPGGGPPPHVHSREEEGFYVLDGEITFTVNGEKIVAKAGMFANMPVGTPHSFKNESDRPAKMLISVAPAGLEKMFFEVGVPLEEGATIALPPSHQEIEKLLAVAPGYGVAILLTKH